MLTPNQKGELERALKAAYNDLATSDDISSTTMSGDELYQFANDHSNILPFFYRYDQNSDGEDFISALFSLRVAEPIGYKHYIEVTFNFEALTFSYDYPYAEALAEIESLAITADNVRLGLKKLYTEGSPF